MRPPWGGAKRATITRSQNRILTLILTVYYIFENIEIPLASIESIGKVNPSRLD